MASPAWDRRRKNTRRDMDRRWVRKTGFKVTVWRYTFKLREEQR